MLIDQWSRVLAASVAPVVMISATALLCLAFYNRLAAIVGRIRTMQRERMTTQEQMDDVPTSRPGRYPALRQTCILESLADQSNRLQRRARLVRATLLCLLSAIAALVVSSLLNGIGVLWPAAVIVAAGSFICGMMLFLAGISCAIGEMFVALDPAELETSIVDELTGEVAA